MTVRRAEPALPPQAGEAESPARPGAERSEPSPRPPLPENDAPSGPVDRALRFGRGLGVAGAILFFWSGAFALAWVVVPYLSLRERDPLARRRAMQRLVAASWRWFHRMLERLTLYRVDYRGGTLADGPAVLVANHPSLLDVTAIIARMPYACCVVKSSLVNSPLVGRLLRACGHVAAGDGSLMAGMGVLDAVRARLDEGFPVLVFPEGTRSPPRGMRAFRRGAFEMAKRAGVPVVPLFLRCDPPALGKGTLVWRHPRRCPTLTVDVGAPRATDAGTPMDLCKNVETEFRARLGLAESPESERA